MSNNTGVKMKTKIRIWKLKVIDGKEYFYNRYYISIPIGENHENYTHVDITLPDGNVIPLPLKRWKFGGARRIFAFFPKEMAPFLKLKKGRIVEYELRT